MLERALGPGGLLALLGPRAQHVLLPRDLGRAFREVPDAGLRLVEASGQVRAPGFIGRDPRRERRERRLRGLGGRAGVLDARPRAGGVRLLALAGRVEARALGLEPCERRGRVLGQGALAGRVRGDLFEPGLRLPPRVVHAGLFGVEPVPRHGQAVQLGRRLGLGLAQGRDGRRHLGLGRGGAGGLAGQLRHARFGCFEAGLGGRDRLGGRLPA